MPPEGNQRLAKGVVVQGPKTPQAGQWKYLSGGLHPEGWHPAQGQERHEGLHSDGVERVPNEGSSARKGWNAAGTVGTMDLCLPDGTTGTGRRHAEQAD